ncbi:MAG: hypothetical protein GZ085_14070 [Sulfuriferula multivorans]|uniref:Uncharacterized protein n=1 Tax=Sulfuriferula multivorans TaxID=1559896 RepID=A0A7C9TC18_9PROT|nr:hypothetical protein [Sulfuriferula multivorans]
MAIIVSQGNPADSDMIKGTPWRMAKLLLIVFSFLALGALNVLTLVSDQVHAAGYSAITAILAKVAPATASARFLSNSPTAKMQRDIAVATKKSSQEKAVLVASSKALEAKHVALEKNFNKVEASHAALKRTAEIRAVAVKTTSRRLAVRSLKNVTRNVGAVFGEAVPFLGTSIMLTVTALDVRDACETLKDINKLNDVFDLQIEDETKVCGMEVPTAASVLHRVKTKSSEALQSAKDALD